eukprot:13420159-Heterocapsa_arctica.AAC.1
MATTSGSENVQPALQVWLGHRASFDLLFKHKPSSSTPYNVISLLISGSNTLPVLSMRIGEDSAQNCVPAHWAKPLLSGQCPARHAV